MPNARQKIIRTGQAEGVNLPHDKHTEAGVDETHQIKQVKIEYTAPPVQEFQALGYDKQHVIDKTRSAAFYWQENTIDASLLPNGTGHIDSNHFLMTETVQNGIYGNNLIWDPLPELENLPVSGFPEQTQQQYVLYDVNPPYPARVLSKAHIHRYSNPNAYGVWTSTEKPSEYVYQVPKSALIENMTGSSFLQKLKKWLIGETDVNGRLQE